MKNALSACLDAPWEGGAPAPPNSTSGEAGASPSQGRRFSVFGVKSCINQDVPKPCPSFASHSIGFQRPYVS
jgi:hypothetical protein